MTIRCLEMVERCSRLVVMMAALVIISLRAAAIFSFATQHR
jgi:hypothetical protein